MCGSGTTTGDPDFELTDYRRDLLDGNEVETPGEEGVFWDRLYNSALYYHMNETNLANDTTFSNFASNNTEDYFELAEVWYDLYEELSTHSTNELLRITKLDELVDIQDSISHYLAGLDIDSLTSSTNAPLPCSPLRNWRMILKLSENVNLRYYDKEKTQLEYIREA